MIHAAILTAALLQGPTCPTHVFHERESFPGTRHMALDGDLMAHSGPGVLGVELRRRTPGPSAAGSWVTEASIPTSFVVSDVALDGEVLVVGRLRQAAEVYRRTGGTWSLEAQLFAHDQQPGNASDFGSQVAVDGDVIAIASPYNTNSSGLVAGAVYVYRHGGLGWSYEQKVYPELGALRAGTGLDLERDELVASDRFGVEVHAYSGGRWRSTGRFALAGLAGSPTAVDLEGDWLAVGDGVPTASSSYPGTVVLARRGPNGEWSETDRVDAPLGDVAGGFGDEVALRDGRLLVVARATQPNHFGALLYDHDPAGQLALSAALRSTGQAQGQAFNVGAVALGGDFAVAAAVDGVLAYDLTGQIGERYCVAASNSTGGRAWIFAAGSDALECGGFTLGALHVPTGSAGYFLLSDTTAQIPGFSGSSGVLCLGQPIRRLSNQVVVGDPGERVLLPLATMSLPIPGGWQSGERWNFQLWFRDVDPGPTSNTSNGLGLRLW